MVPDPRTYAWGPSSHAHPWANGPIVNTIDGFDVHTVYTAERLFSDIDGNGIDEAVVVDYPTCDWRATGTR